MTHRVFRCVERKRRPLGWCVPERMVADEWPSRFKQQRIPGGALNYTTSRCGTSGFWWQLKNRRGQEVRFVSGKIEESAFQ